MLAKKIVFWGSQLVASWGGQLVLEYRIIYNIIININIKFCGSLAHYPNTALLFDQKKMTSPCQGSDLSSLGRLILKKQGLITMMMMSRKKWQIFPRGCSAQCPVNRSWCAQRCCDGAATESLLRRSCADQLRRAHSACRVSTRRAE